MPKEILGEGLAADLQRAHAIMTRGLAVVCSWNSLDEGKCLYAHTLISLITFHHSHEDELFFPQIIAKDDSFPLAKLHDDHERLHTLLDKADNALRADAGKVEAGKVISIFFKIKELWTPHITVEEKFVTQNWVDEHYAAEELLALGKEDSQYMKRNIKSPSLIFPFVMYHLTPNERAIFMKPIPRIITGVIVPYIWKWRYRKMVPHLPHYS